MAPHAPRARIQRAAPIVKEPIVADTYRKDPEAIAQLTPEQYRERWGLPPDYPMVAPNYARQRSRLAKEIGLGTRARRGRN